MLNSLNAVFDFNGEELNGNCSVGQLTTIGYEQHLLNGASLRKTYVESGFLSDTISPSEVYLRSDSKCGTLLQVALIVSSSFYLHGRRTSNSAGKDLM